MEAMFLWVLGWCTATIRGINIKEHSNAEIMPEPRKLQHWELDVLPFQMDYPHHQFS